MNINIRQTDNDTVIIYSGGLARKLLRLGYTIVDVMPNNQNPEKTVFVFSEANKIAELLSKPE